MQKSSKYIANILNFKWEMKRSLSNKQRLNFLHSLELTESLIEHHLGKSAAVVGEERVLETAMRSAAAYFDFLANKSPSSLYCAEYLEFFSRKAD